MLKITVLILTLFGATALVNPVLADVVDAVVDSQAQAGAGQLTGLPSLDMLLKLVGALTALLTVLAQLLPKDWKFTQLLARASVDLKGVSPGKLKK